MNKARSESNTNEYQESVDKKSHLIVCKGLISFGEGNSAYHNIH